MDTWQCCRGATFLKPAVWNRFRSGRVGCWLELDLAAQIVGFAASEANKGPGWQSDKVVIPALCGDPADERQRDRDLAPLNAVWIPAQGGDDN